ncbi:hypothetical protein PIB30_058473 [Stylosanthes scabra]|uniref:Uncharacterized protein n=1 Tax=Stylosanthes scabra TaxID=79078 RepID=A0ABU6YHD5_9FABA|nr:hypothetical protein [Stylosanthes scabra]
MSGHDTKFARKNKKDILQESGKRLRTFDSSVSNQTTQKAERHVNNTSGPRYYQDSSPGSKRHITNEHSPLGTMTQTQRSNVTTLSTNRIESAASTSINEAVHSPLHHEKENFSSHMLTCDTMNGRNSVQYFSRKRAALTEVDTNILGDGIVTTCPNKLSLRLNHFLHNKDFLLGRNKTLI